MRITEIHKRGWLVFAGKLFAVSLVINFIWEMAQMPLYQNIPFNKASSWLFCFRASLGDGFIILFIWGLGVIIFGQQRWYKPLSFGRLLYLLGAGGAIAVGFELHALATLRWRYSELMPLLPILKVGVSPFVQLLVLPIISMKATRRFFVRR